MLEYQATLIPQPIIGAYVMVHGRVYTQHYSKMYIVHTQIITVKCTHEQNGCINAQDNIIVLAFYVVLLKVLGLVK